MDLLIKTYQAIQDKGDLIFLNPPLNQNKIQDCIIELLYNVEEEDPIFSYLRNYLGCKETEDILDKITSDSELKNFKSIFEYLSGKTKNPSKPFTKHITKRLLEFEFLKVKEFKSLEETYFGDSFLEKILIQRLIDIYQNHKRFSVIPIDGDVNNELNDLPMDEYYVNTSYISSSEINNRESLIFLEKNDFSSKVEPKIYSNFSEDYISQSLLNNRKVIVIGNPGVGKSTYAKWLCYDWANRNDSNVLPVYIQLRDVDFNDKDSLKQYISENYLYNTALEYGINDIKSNLKLILDGYDEISQEKKNKLGNSIGHLDYVILSRPYGLINNRLDIDISVQIDGFNDIAIDTYISKLICDNDKEHDLKKIIERNKVLEDYASNPLMLSYIVLIFLKTSNANNELSSITSRFNLQEVVFDWILNYGLKKQNIDVTKLSEEIVAIEKFAFQMITKKQFIYVSSFDDGNYNTAQNIARIGIGTIRYQNNKFRWRFSFNSVTFQEFLASRYFVKKLDNHEAFVYLVTDNFFWNFCLMTVGELSNKKNKKNSSILHSVLNFLKVFFENKNHKFYGNAYYMLLAECNPQLINEVFDKKQLIRLINFYKDAYFDAFWEVSIYDAIEKIVFKSNQDIKKEFISYFLRILPKIYDTSKENLLENYYYLSNLLKIGMQYDEEKLSKELIETTSNLRKNISSWSASSAAMEKEFGSKSNDDIDPNILNEYYSYYNKENWGRETLGSLFIQFGYFSEPILEQYQDEIQVIFRESNPNVTDLRRVISRIYKDEDENLLITYRSLKKTIYGSDESILLQQDYFEDTLSISEKVYLDLIKIDQNEIPTIYENISSFIARGILKTDFDNYDNYFYANYLTDVIIECLVFINSKKSLTLLFEICEKFDARPFSRIQNQSFLDNYLKKELKKITKNNATNNLERFSIIVKNCVSETLFFQNYRKSILETFLNGLSNDISAFEENLVILSYLRSMFIIKQDKNYLISNIHSINPEILNDPRYLENLFTGFIFYEKKYWNIIRSAIKSKDSNFEIGISFLENNQLYFFSSNHYEIINIYLSLIISATKDDIEENAEVLLLVLNEILQIVKKVDSELKDKIIHYSSRIFNNSIVKSYCEYEVEDLSDIKYISSFLLFYQFDDNLSEFLSSLRLYEQLEREPGALAGVIDELIKFSINENYGIEIIEIEKYESILNKKFYNELMNVISQRLLNKNQYDYQHLMMLIN